MHRYILCTVNLYALYFSQPLKRTNPHLVRFISNVFIYELVYCINGVEVVPCTLHVILYCLFIKHLVLYVIFAFINNNVIAALGKESMLLAGKRLWHSNKNLSK